MSMPLPDGLHERLVTSAVDDALADVPNRYALVKVDAADQPHVLARHVYQAVRRALETTADPEDRLALINDLLDRVDAGPASACDRPQNR